MKHFIFTITLFLAGFSSSAQAQTSNETPVFKLSQVCEFNATAFGKPYTKEVSIYTSYQQTSPGLELGLVMVDGIAIQGELSRNGLRDMFAGGNKYNSVVLKNIRAEGIEKIDFNQARKPDTSITIKKTSSRGTVTDETLTGNCDYINGSESIGAHN